MQLFVCLKIKAIDKKTIP